MVLFAAALALAVLWLVSPYSTELAWLITAAIVSAAGLLLWLVGPRTPRELRGGDTDLARMHQALAQLPAQQREHQPLILVTGDGLSALFDRAGDMSVTHVGHGAIWLRVDNPQDLSTVALAAQQWRGGIPPDGAMVSVVPAQYTDVDGIEQSLRSIRQAVVDASRAIGARLPTYVALYQRLTRSDASAMPDWYGVCTDRSFIRDAHFDAVMRAAEQQAGAGGLVGSAERAATLAALLPWTRSVVLDTFANAQQPCAPLAVRGVAWTDAGPASGGHRPWEREVAARTGVTPPDAPASTLPWPFPQLLLGAVCRPNRLRPVVRACAHALALLAGAAALAFWAAGRNNEMLLARVQNHLERYAAVEPGHDAAKRDALRPLVSDRDQLDQYARLGVPLRLSFGMYRGAMLMPLLDRAIASYLPPVPPPSVITLDSMSLFDSGRATLKAGSTKLMVDAVEMIKAHADKRVLVAGYTDDVGSPTFNLKLSKARAEAVRDWLVEASGLPATQFAIQGYGQTRPIADNHTDAGRARNRRVEITLVPDSGA